MTGVLDALRERTRRPLLLDGAMSTLVHAVAGSADAATPTDALTLAAPDVVRAVHEAYIEAGADIIRTNTFGAASRAHVAHARALSEAAARLARAAADDGSARTPSSPHLVAGAIGPSDAVAGRGHTLTPSAAEQLRETFRGPLAGLLAGGVDLVLLETWFSPAQTWAALAAFADACTDTGREVPLMVSTALARDGRVAVSGASLADLVGPFVSVAAVAGINCGEGPVGLEPALATLGAQFRLVSCHPSAGLPDHEGRYPHAPEALASSVGAYAAAGLAHIVGGCCGTTPAHIRALAAALPADPDIGRRRNAVATARRAGRQ
jgi:5-methyltetrahydrofolate--homocysteine methyltransferase